MPVTFFSYIFQHIIVLLVIFWVAVGYIYRGPIFGFSPTDDVVVEMKIPVQQPVEEKPNRLTKKVKPDSSKLLVRQSAEQVRLSETDKDFSFRDELANDSTLSQPKAVTEADMLQAARKAYWNGDKLLAKELYIKAAKQFPKSLDILGETGNIFYENADTAGAVEYWGKLLPLLNKKGLNDKARRVERLIVNLSPDNVGTK